MNHHTYTYTSDAGTYHATCCIKCGCEAFSEKSQDHARNAFLSRWSDVPCVVGADVPLCDCGDDCLTTGVGCLNADC